MEEELQEMKLSLETKSTNKIWAKENWSIELRNIQGQLAVANKRVAELTQDVISRDAKINSLRSLPHALAA